MSHETLEKDTARTGDKGHNHDNGPSTRKIIIWVILGIIVMTVVAYILFITGNLSSGDLVMPTGPGGYVDEEYFSQKS